LAIQPVTRPIASAITMLRVSMTSVPESCCPAAAMIWATIPYLSSEKLPSHMNDTSIGIENALMHGFAQGRMREDGVDQFFLSRLEPHGDDEPLDEFGHLRADHMGAKQPAGFGIENRLHQSLIFAKSDRLAIADKGEPADFEFVTCGPRLGLGQA